MPVYNEEAAIQRTIRSWASEIDRLGVPYEFLVYDDGSKDRTEAILRELASTVEALDVRHHANMGHGPTILRGYREARGEWIFQTDSDGEMETVAFPELWQQRDGFDCLLGTRLGREATLTRRALTASSRLTVRFLFGGGGVTDVNSPYRLMRGAWLRRMLPLLPPDLFAPNVILAGLARRSGARIREFPVRHQNRRHGASSLGSFKVLRPALRSFAQTWQVARSTRAMPSR